MTRFLGELFYVKPLTDADFTFDGAYEALRQKLRQAGLSEEELRSMDPDDRVAALEQARLDPYDYIYLAC